jgi:pimeloyl-ACP methyl ester carboxylesterase
MASANAFNGLGVVIVPPVGYDHVTSFRALQVLGRELAERGCLVARVDPFGTGDSAGVAADVTGLRVWDNAVHEGATYLRESGAREVLLIGCRMGAALALLAAPSVSPVAVVVLDPVLSGRRYVRGLQVMSQEHDQAGVGLLVGGTEFPKSLLDDMAALDLAGNVPVLEASCLLVARPGSNAEPKLAEHLAKRGSKAEVWFSPALEGFLGVHAEQAVVDPAFTSDVAGWICGWAPGAGEAAVGGAGLARPLQVPESAGDATSMRWGDHWITERFVTLGTEQLVGVLTTPSEVKSPTGDLVVFVNSGAEPHTGPARAWVEYGRELATHGISSLRVDMRGWGDSPEGPGGRYEPGHPYDPHSMADVRHILRSLGDVGWDRVFLSGLCAGAWLALHVARDTRFAGVLAINPAFEYELGGPIVASGDEYRKLYAAEIAERKREAVAGRWDREDRAGLRPPVGEWLDALVDNEIPISLIFCENDVGLEYISDRLSLRLASVQESGWVRLHEVYGIDHSMHRIWLRWKIVEIFLNELNHWTEVAGGARDPLSSRP